MFIEYKCYARYCAKPQDSPPGLLTMEFHIWQAHYNENTVVFTLLSVNFTKSNSFFKNTKQRFKKIKKQKQNLGLNVFQ